MADEERCNRGLQTTAINKRQHLSWGANSHGQLGIGNTEDQLVPSSDSALVLHSLGAPDEAWSLGGGGGFSFVLTERGQVFTCGNNDRGQLGHGNRENRTIFFPVCVSLSQGRIRKVAAGWDFMLGLSESGQVFSWGSNSFGQLGRPLKSATSYDATAGVVHDLSQNKQVDIAAGLRHAISLSDCDQVYTWGSGKKGQLGLEDNEGRPLLKTSHPLCVKVPTDKKIHSVVAGMYHTALLTSSGTVFTWGCNRYGQCGVDPNISSIVLAPHKIACSNHNTALSFISLASGWTHLIARIDVGDLYSWGRADLGQLGRKCEKGCDYLPSPIPGLSLVQSHTCGSEHNLALTEKGEVYAWGWNEHGICGTGNEENVFCPHRIQGLANKSVTSIGCGAGHSFLCCS